MFRGRLDSLEHDIKRCFWPISEPSSPGPAFFPPVMYCFSTLDYFSSFWAGWNKVAQKGQDQNDRMVGFSEIYLLYPRKETQIAINFWRHKLMHTAEPRILEESVTKETYYWSIGTDIKDHMALVKIDNPNKFMLHFSPIAFVKDFSEAIFGPTGYFKDIQGNIDLQNKYRTCYSEFENYKITIKP
jgi:hypothetical protein